MQGTTVSGHSSNRGHSFTGTVILAVDNYKVWVPALPQRNFCCCGSYFYGRSRSLRMAPSLQHQQTQFWSMATWNSLFLWSFHKIFLWLLSLAMSGISIIIQKKTVYSHLISPIIMSGLSDGLLRFTRSNSSQFSEINWLGLIPDFPEDFASCPAVEIEVI